jgi:8-oxo-dGTP pyrophosphatase MutT (NUDIX family)
MQREFSAGGVLVRRLRGEWVLAAIRPGGKPAGLWALPKGRIDDGESGEATALREVEEETGARGRSLGKLGDVRYWFNWRGEKIFKVVSFFLVRYEGGRLGAIADEFRHEVAEVRWLPLADAPRLLAYGGEREMAAKALAALADRTAREDV